MLLTKMFTCTAARPTVAGAMSSPICRKPRVARGPVGPEAKAQAPQRRPLHQELREPAGERAARPAQDHLLDAQAHAPEDARPHDRDQVEEGRRQRRDAEAALGVQHSHRDGGERDERQERHHHAREAHGELGLAGRVVEAGSDPRDERPGQQDAENDHEAQGHAQERQHAAREPEARLRPAFPAGAGVGGHEGRGERALRRTGPAAGSGCGRRSGRRPSGSRPRGAPRTPARGRGRGCATRASSPTRARPPSRCAPFRPAP